MKEWLEATPNHQLLTMGNWKLILIHYFVEWWNEERTNVQRKISLVTSSKTKRTVFILLRYAESWKSRDDDEVHCFPLNFNLFSACPKIEEQKKFEASTSSRNSLFCVLNWVIKIRITTTLAPPVVSLLCELKNIRRHLKSSHI